MAQHEKQEGNSPDSERNNLTGGNVDNGKKSAIADGVDGGDKNGADQKHARRDGEEAPQNAPSGRPMRQTCMVARDHILAWRLQQQWSFRAYAGAIPDSGSKARKATKAASATRKVPVSKKGVTIKKGAKTECQARTSKVRDAALKKRSEASETVLPKAGRGRGAGLAAGKGSERGTGREKKMHRRVVKPRRGSAQPEASDGERDGAGEKSQRKEAEKSQRKEADAVRDKEIRKSGGPGKGEKAATGANKVDKSKVKRKETEEERQKRRARIRKQMEVDARIQRTMAIAETGMKEHEWHDLKTCISFMLCPADQGRQENSQSYMGRLRTPNLSTPPEATVLHLKRFLISKLLPQGSLSEIQIVCRGLILRDDKTLYTIKHFLWPKNHSLDPVLRFRRVVKQEESASLASAPPTHSPSQPKTEIAQVLQARKHSAPPAEQLKPQSHAYALPKQHNAAAAGPAQPPRVPSGGARQQLPVDVEKQRALAAQAQAHGMMTHSQVVRGELGGVQAHGVGGGGMGGGVLYAAQAQPMGRMGPGGMAVARPKAAAMARGAGHAPVHPAS